jgi:pimeloyl-ACP methyl ester carboxylesterase
VLKTNGLFVIADWIYHDTKKIDDTSPLVNETQESYQKILDDSGQSMPEMAGRIQVTESILQQIALCKNHDARSYIDRICSPTLIVSGLKEPVVTKTESKRLASAIKNVKQIILLDCDHMLQRESSDELAKELLNFLTTIVV